MELICIDFEASGLGAESYPIEVAWKSTSSDISTDCLINPDSAEGWDYWDEFAEELHGIDREMLQQGLSVAEVCSKMNEELAGCDLICDALEFDSFWLQRLFTAAGMKPTFKLKGLDTILSPEQLIQYRLVSKTQFRRHRAMRDVEDLIKALDAVTSPIPG